MMKIHIELTNKCNKGCWMCGRRRMEKENPNIEYEDEIDWSLLEHIAEQVPKGTLISFHNNGEPTCYSRLGDALKLFDGHIRHFNTNGKLLMEKAEEIIHNLEVLTLSTFENDPEWEEQLFIFKTFLLSMTICRYKEDIKPNCVIRCLGEMPFERMEQYRKLNLPIARRVLHSPYMSNNYTKQPTIPEYGICQDLLSTLAINCKGDVSHCVRLDKDGLGVLGNIKKDTLEEIWNGHKRKEIINNHIEFKRDKHPLCAKCDFYGIPTGY